MKLIAELDLAHVREWPHRIEGEIEVVDGGVSCTESLEAAVESFWGAARLHGPACEVGFELRGDILRSAGILPEELDEPGAKFIVSLQPIEGRGIPVAHNGKVEYIQRYRAVAIQRAE